LVAGLSISAPADRLEEGWLARVRDTAAQISTSLGYRVAAVGAGAAAGSASAPAPASR
jgi:hypothetical protein